MRSAEPEQRLPDRQPAGGRNQERLHIYTDRIAGSPAATYQVIAAPEVPNQTGVRYFCSFADGVVRASPTVITTCDIGVPPLQ